MAITARAEPDNARKPLGHARLVISGVPADASRGASGFRLRREGHSRNNLGPNGWQVGEELLQPLNILEEGADTVLVLGPRLTRHLEVGPVFLVLPGLGEAGLIWPDTIEVYDGELPEEVAIAPEPAEVLTAPATAPSPAPKAAPTPPAPPTPQPDPPPVPPAPSAKKMPVLALAGGGAALAAVLAVWFLLGHEGAESPASPPPVASAPPTVQPAAPPRPPAAAPSPAWPESADALSPRDVVGRAPDAAGIRLAALRRQQQGQHDDALVLLEEAAERGDAQAKTALGRLYDPIGFTPGRPFRTPDPRAAARQYRDAERAGDPAAAPLRAALRGWLQQQSEAGNAAAAATLREFW